MAILKWLILVAAVGYAALVLLVYLAQRSLMYFPDRVRTPPSVAGLPQAEELVLDSADGERIIAWHVPPRGDRHVVIYFHGNGGALVLRADRFRALIADGTGLLAVSYRGYGGSSGSPSERGLIADAAAAYAFAAARYPVDRIALWGESLGTGVAIALAADHPVSRLILDSPYTSAADVGAAVYPFLPVRFLIKDAFHSDRRIGAVHAPILILHGARDDVVPIAYGERLLKLANEPKRLIRFPLGGHTDLDAYGAVAARHAFLNDARPQ